MTRRRATNALLPAIQGDLSQYEIDHVRAVVAASLAKQPDAAIRSALQQLVAHPNGNRQGLIDLANLVEQSEALNPAGKTKLGKAERERALLAHPIAGELLVFMVESLCRLSSSCGDPRNTTAGLTAAELGRELASAFRASGKPGGRQVQEREKRRLQRYFCDSFLRHIGGPVIGKSCSPRAFERARKAALNDVYEQRNGQSAPAGTAHHGDVIAKLGAAYQVLVEDYRPQS